MLEMLGEIMKITYRELVGSVMIFCVLVSSYLIIVQIVDALEPSKFFGSFEVKSLHSSSSTDVFSAGDSLVFEFTSWWADSYAVEFYHNSSLILSQSGELNNDAVKCVSVALSSPVFEAGSTYAACFYGYSFNKPVLGVFYSDSFYTVFEVVGVETRLSLVGDYNSEWNQLRLYANLTDAEGYPIVDELVKFSMASREMPEPTDSFLPIGEAWTNSSGIVAFGMAFCAPSGNYSVEARHEGNEEFGESKNVTRVSVSPSMYPENLESCYQGAGDSFLMSGLDDFWVSSSQYPIALLENHATATYRCSTRLDPNLLHAVVFFVDFMNSTGCMGVSSLVNETEEEGFYYYKAHSSWYPKIIGYHTLRCGFVSGDIFTINTAIATGTTLANCSKNVEIKRCPSRLVLNAPSVAYGDSVPITVAFAKPRAYTVCNTGFFTRSRLAPKIYYDYFENMEIECTWDETVESIPVKLYVNGTLDSTISTDENGLAVFTPRLNSSESSYNFTASVDSSASLYNLTSVNQISSLKNVDVRDVKDSGTQDASLNLTVGGVWSKNASAILGVESSIEANSTFCDEPIQSAPISFLAAKFVSRHNTASNGQGSVPQYQSDYLHVDEIYAGFSNGQRIKISFSTATQGKQVAYADSQHFAAVPLDAWDLTLLGLHDGDMNGDEVVDIFDIVRVALVFGSVRGMPLYDHASDLNGDGVVDIFDVVVVAIDYGNAASFVEAAVDFFKVDFNSTSATNNMGSAATVWVPSEVGTYVVKANLTQYFNVTTKDFSGGVATKGCLNAFGYCDVVRRNVSLTINVPDIKVERIEASADAFVDEAWSGWNFGGWDNVSLGVGDLWGYTVKHNYTYVLFDVSAIPANACIVHAELCFYVSAVMDKYWLPINGFYMDAYVYRVCGSWSEMGITWNNQPTCLADPSCVHLEEWLGSGCPLMFDVTGDVQAWVENPSTNFGLAVKGDLCYDEGIPILGTACLESREHGFGSWHPFLMVSYAEPDMGELVAYDSVIGQPVCNLSASLYVDDEPAGNCVTNSSGVALLDWIPTADAAYEMYNVTVSFAGNDTYEPAQSSEFFDFRLPMNLTSVEGDCINVSRGAGNHMFEFEVGIPHAYYCLFGRPFDVSVNGTFVNGTCYDGWSEEYTGYGFLCFDWGAPADGTYSVRLMFEGDVNVKPCELHVAVNASVTPLAVLFDVSPKEFQPGTTIQLNATILYAGTNSRFTGYNTAIEFLDFRPDGSNSSQLACDSDRNGEVILSMEYPVDGFAHAYVARIVPEILEDKFPQGIVSNPVQLIVANNTKIVLNTTRPDPSSTVHYFVGRVVWNNTAVRDRPVNVTINQTCYYCGLTNASGYFSFSADLRPVENKATAFMVLACFEDNVTLPTNATAWAKTPDGQDYPACITTQYGYKPSAKSLSLTVSLEKTNVVDPDKSPEEMQQEAETRGLQVWGPDSFSIFPPFFKLHARVVIDWLNIDIHSWVGLFACGIDSFTGIGRLLQKPFENSPESAFDLITSAFISSVATGVTLYATSLIAAQFTSYTPSYWLTLSIYTLAGIMILGGLSLLPDAKLARAMLFGIGATLLSLVIGAYMPESLAFISGSIKSLPFFITTELSGSDPVRSAAKSLINPFVNKYLYMSSMTSWIVFRVNPLMNLFAVATLGLAVWALYLGYTRI